MTFTTRQITSNSAGSRAYVEQSGRPPLLRVMFEGRIIATFAVKHRQIAKTLADGFNAGMKEGRRYV